MRGACEDGATATYSIKNEISDSSRLRLLVFKREEGEALPERSAQDRFIVPCVARHDGDNRPDEIGSASLPRVDPPAAAAG